MSDYAIDNVQAELITLHDQAVMCMKHKAMIPEVTKYLVRPSYDHPGRWELCTSFEFTAPLPYIYQTSFGAPKLHYLVNMGTTPALPFIRLKLGCFKCC